MSASKMLGREVCPSCGQRIRGIDRNEVIELRQAGMTFRAIGERLGVSYQRAQQVWAQHQRDAPPAAG